MSIYKYDISEYYKGLKSYLLRNLLIIILFFILVGIKGYFNSFTMSVIVWVFFSLLLIYIVRNTKNYYSKVILELVIEDQMFRLKYLNYNKEENILFEKLCVKAKFGLTNYSRKSIIPVKMLLICEKGTYIFYPTLTELIKFLSVVKRNKGVVPNDFDFRITLKEIYNFKEYADLKAEIKEILS